MKAYRYLGKGIPGRDTKFKGLETGMDLVCTKNAKEDE